MKRVLFALFITALCTNETWSEDIHPAKPAAASKAIPTAVPVKKHWFTFSKAKASPHPKVITPKKEGK